MYVFPHRVPLVSKSATVPLVEGVAAYGGAVKTAWSWVKPWLWTCTRCGSAWLTAELSPVCAKCGFRETAS